MFIASFLHLCSYCAGLDRAFLCRAVLLVFDEMYSAQTSLPHAVGQPNETCFLLLFPATAASLLLLQGLSADMLATDLAEYLVRKGVPFR